jgi:hypothetical protein
MRLEDRNSSDLLVEKRKSRERGEGNLSKKFE